MRLIILNSIIGQKEKCKIENKIRSLLDPVDFDRWFVINEVDRDLILLDVSFSKFSDLESFLSELNVLIYSTSLNLDDILDKINTNGIDSLHGYERIFLDEYKQLF